MRLLIEVDYSPRCQMSLLYSAIVRSLLNRPASVSYTHLDVYKRQDDGWLPMNAKINGQLHPTDADYADWYARAARGYDSWVEMTAATGLPLAQNTLLDEGDTCLLYTSRCV